MTDEERFDMHTERKGSKECWPFRGYCNEQGYGRMRWRGRLKMAPRIALELSGSPRPSRNHFALHSCDNPSCVNPSHLRWGTKAENAADAMERGRIYLEGLCGRGSEKWKTRLAQQEAAKWAGRAVACPKCGADPGEKCVGRAEHKKGRIHIERLRAGYLLAGAAE